MKKAKTVTEDEVLKRYFSLIESSKNTQKKIDDLKEEIAIYRRAAIKSLQGCWLTYYRDNRSYLVRIAEIKEAVAFANPLVADNKIMINAVTCFFMESFGSSILNLSNSEIIAVCDDEVNPITTQQAFDIVGKFKYLNPEVDVIFNNAFCNNLEFYDGLPKV